MAHDLLITGMQFFLHKTYSIYSTATGRRASFKKVSFVKNCCVFLLAVVSNRCALTPAVCRIFFADAPHVLIMFWHDFG